MPRYIRSFVPGATYFFTVALEDRSSYLLVQEIQRLRRAYCEVQRRHAFETVAICILPDHLHALWKLPEEDKDFSTRWSQIKRGFSLAFEGPEDRSASKEKRREKGVWQRRHWEHQVRDDEDFRNHVNYIHFNPVKHGHSREVRDWPFSSFHRWVKQGLLPKEWGLVRAAGNAEDFGERDRY